MTKELETEIRELIDIAWAEYDKAVERKDEETAEFFKYEAFELISRLPENMVLLKDLK